MALDLKLLQERLDKVLSEETAESLNAWLEKAENIAVPISGGEVKEEETLLSNFLKFVDEDTHFFEDKDVTISQVVQAYLNKVR